jgi:hypothetical protein
MIPYVAGFVALVVLLAPRRLGEISRAGWALAVLGVGYGGGVVAFEFALREVVAVTGVIAGLAEIVGFAGLLLRARWASVVLAVGAVAAASLMFGRVALPQFAESAFCMAVAAVLSWRDAHHGAGTLRAFLA